MPGATAPPGTCPPPHTRRRHARQPGALRNSSRSSRNASGVSSGARWPAPSITAWRACGSVRASTSAPSRKSDMSCSPAATRVRISRPASPSGRSSSGSSASGASARSRSWRWWPRHRRARARSPRRPKPPGAALTARLSGAEAVHRSQDVGPRRLVAGRDRRLPEPGEVHRDHPIAGRGGGASAAIEGYARYSARSPGVT